MTKVKILMEGLTFSEALNALKLDKGVRRKCWNLRDFVLKVDEEVQDKELDTVSDAYFKYHDVINNRVRQYVPTTEDLLADDWQILYLDSDKSCTSTVYEKFELEIKGEYQRFLGDKFSEACAEGKLPELIAQAARSVMFENVNTININVKHLDT